MTTLRGIKTRINAAEQLRSIIHSMKSLAIINVRQYERAAKAVTRFSETIESGFQVAIRNRPDLLENMGPTDAGGPTVQLVLGSDHGMCGPFNDRIVQFLLNQQERNGIPGDNGGRRILIAAGHRLRSPLHLSNVEPDLHLSMPGSVEMIDQTVETTLEHLDRFRREQDVRRIRLYYHRRTGERGYEPVSEDLIPLDRDHLRELADRPWPTNNLPEAQPDETKLFQTLVRHHLYIGLYHAYAHSLACENEGRLQSMQGAEENVETRLDELNREHVRRRQQSITDELLDITSGFEALRGDEPV
jgi:F-type H+-transporting ATPase subunit gamma